MKKLLLLTITSLLSMNVFAGCYKECLDACLGSGNMFCGGPCIAECNAPDPFPQVGHGHVFGSNDIRDLIDNANDAAGH